LMEINKISKKKKNKSNFIYSDYANHPWIK